MWLNVNYWLTASFTIARCTKITLSPLQDERTVKNNYKVNYFMNERPSGVSLKGAETKIHQADCTQALPGSERNENYWVHKQEFSSYNRKRNTSSSGIASRRRSQATLWHLYRIESSRYTPVLTKIIIHLNKMI